MRRKEVRKRGHPEGEQLLHYNVKGSHWGKRVDYVKGVGWVGDGISKKLQEPPPFQGRTKQYSGVSSVSSNKARAIAATKTMGQTNSGMSTFLKKAAKKDPEASLAKRSSSSTSSSSSGGGGGSSSGSKYDADLRAKLDALRGNSEKAQKDREKAEKEAEKERKKAEAEEKRKQREAETARRREENERKRAQREAEREENKAYKQRLSIERQARQLFDKWKQEEVRKSKKKDNTLKKSKVSFVSERGHMKPWNAPRRSRSNKMT